VIDLGAHGLHISPIIVFSKLMQLYEQPNLDLAALEDLNHVV
jgi:hypothetical protein